MSENANSKNVSPKHIAAEARNAKWRKRSPKEQLADLDKRLGAGLGAAKPRARLQATIAATTKKVKVTEEPTTGPRKTAGKK